MHLTQNRTEEAGTLRVHHTASTNPQYRYALTADWSHPAYQPAVQTHPHCGSTAPHRQTRSMDTSHCGFITPHTTPITPRHTTPTAHHSRHVPHTPHTVARPVVPRPPRVAHPAHPRSTTMLSVNSVDHQASYYVHRLRGPRRFVHCTPIDTPIDTCRLAHRLAHNWHTPIDRWHR